MKILSMTATFGKLDGASLRLADGLNVICAPNEWGKSTWCAFLTAMFYGIDTRERSTQEKLADKDKYQPWSGRPMEGTLRFVHEGKDITIQRRTKGRVPMGEFSAYETLTGVPIQGLTGENCGQLLLGVEKSVFTRTGFIRFSDLPVNQDEALRRRLNALVTTGDESGSADLLGRKLRELKNKVKYNRTGLIPETQSKISSLQDQLRERENLEIQSDQLRSRISQTQEYLDQLEVHRSAFAYREAQEDRRRVEEAAEKAKQAQAALEAQSARCAGFPVRGELLGKLRQGQVLLDQIRSTPEAKPASMIPMVLLWILAAFALAGAVLFGAASEPVLMAVCGAFALIFTVAAGILAGRRRRSEVARKLEKSKLDARRAELTRAVAQWQEQLAETDQLERLSKEAEQAKSHLQTLLAMARKAARPEVPDPLELSREETMTQIGHASELLQRCKMQLSQCQGRMESIPDRGMLEAQLEFSQRRLAELERTYRALDYGQKALEAAAQELQRRFAPRITRRAGEFLSILTGGEYDRISIGDDLLVQAARQEETTLRPAQRRSDGTADQMYLALRLAVWETLNPSGPLVLDDALVRFDRQRLENAVRLLKALAQNRQILLFSCQDREKQLIQK